MLNSSNTHIYALHAFFFVRGSGRGLRGHGGSRGVIYIYIYIEREREIDIDIGQVRITPG